MEQYEIRPADCNKTIQTALKYFPPEKLFIRRVGSQGGGVAINKNLKNGQLVIKYSKSSFKFMIDGKEAFLFEFKKSAGDAYVWGKNWSLAYERIDSKGRTNFASAGYPYPGSIYDGPDDPRLPIPETTILRCVNRNYFVEIVFKDKIPIRKTQYKMFGYLDYYEIDSARLPTKPLV